MSFECWTRPSQVSTWRHLPEGTAAVSQQRICWDKATGQSHSKVNICHNVRLERKASHKEIHLLPFVNHGSLKAFEAASIVIFRCFHWESFRESVSLQSSVIIKILGRLWIRERIRGNVEQRSKLWRKDNTFNDGFLNEMITMMKKKKKKLKRMIRF